MVIQRIANIIALAALSGCAASPASSEQRNAAVVRSIYEQCLNQGRMELLDEIVAPDFAAADGSKGPAAFRRTLEALRRAFPDIRYTIHEVVADSERVAIRWTWNGTHTGPFRNIAPTRRRVSNGGLGLFQLRDAKIVDSKVQTDRLGFFDELGMLPAELGALARPGPARRAAGSHGAQQ